MFSWNAAVGGGLCPRLTNERPRSDGDSPPTQPQAAARSAGRVRFAAERSREPWRTGCNTHRDSAGSTGPCAGRAPCSWRPDSSERSTEWSRCCRCSWCRRWLSRSLPPAARLRRWLCSTPAGCCSPAARGSGSHLQAHTGTDGVSDEAGPRLWDRLISSLMRKNNYAG